MPTDITVSVNDERFIVPISETSSEFVAGFLSKAKENNLIRAMGSTGERQDGFIRVPSLDDWFSRLNNPIGTDMLTDGHDEYSGSEDGSEIGARVDGINGRWTEGPTGEWEDEWYAVHNYLRYGGSAVIAGTGSKQNTVSSRDTLQNYTGQLDVLFAAPSQAQGASLELANADLAHVANTRTDVVSILGAGFSGDQIQTVTTGVDTNVTGLSGSTLSQYTFIAPGTKFHLKTSQNIQVESDFDFLKETFLTPDVAGCFARTEQSGRSFKSPAGLERGKILDVVRIGKVVSDTEYDTLFNAGLNPIRTFPEGSFLFGDKTGEAVPDSVVTPTSGTVSRAGVTVFTRINVVRTFLYLKKVIGEASRRYLFEINDAATRQSFISTVTPILRSVQAGRGISEFKVVCDQSNNTDAVINNNEFVTDVFIKPTKSINFIRLRFTNKDNDQTLA